MEWRDDIENAPKDGTQVLTYSPDAPRLGYAAIQVNRWKHGAWQESNEHFWPPTHWMPLPPPPEGRRDD